MLLSRSLLFARMSFNFVNNQQHFRWHRDGETHKCELEMPKKLTFVCEISDDSWWFYANQPLFLSCTWWNKKLLFVYPSPPWPDSKVNIRRARYLAQVTVLLFFVGSTNDSLTTNRTLPESANQPNVCVSFLLFFFDVIIFWVILLLLLTLMLFHEILIWLFNPNDDETQLHVISDFLSSHIISIELDWVRC